jgi:hypothetical protein
LERFALELCAWMTLGLPVRPVPREDSKVI